MYTQMGIKGVKKMLPGKPINLFDHLGCSSSAPRRVAVDSSNPLFSCALKYPKHSFVDDPTPIAAEWRHLLERCQYTHSF